MDFTHIPEFELIVRLVLAAFLGYMIGLERQITGHPAGDRTFALTSLGAAMFTIISLKAFPVGDSRVAAGVVTGLGFLGAGMIIRTQGREIKGLTTAAGIWAVGAIGLAIGSGMYIMGVGSTILVLFLLSSERLLHIDQHINDWRKKRKIQSKTSASETPGNPPSDG
jgi:putative Mg2+ transporter-C (MgtC) family protein